MPQNQSRAILFADIAGSSTLYTSLGNQQAKILIDKAINQMIQLSEKSNGILIKTIGDEIMVRFDSTIDAVMAARSIQQAFATETLSMKIGLSFGPTLLDKGDIFGDTVNAAAYIVNIARAEQILLSSSVFETLSATLASDCHVFDHIQIKGQSHETVIYRLDWEKEVFQPNATKLLSAAMVNRLEKMQPLSLQFKGKDIAINTKQTPFHIGRNADDVNLCIDSSQVSRKHCHVTYRHGKYVLVDHSTNGTYVSKPNHKVIYLRREEFPLQGEGTIAVGQPPAVAGNDCIKFFI